MKKNEIQAWDWQRILFGQAPAEFLLEVLLRTIFMYLLLIVVLRLLGKRMDGQLTLTEVAVMVTLGAIVSVPMQLPDRGLLLGVVALLCVYIFQRGWNWVTVKSADAEAITQGTMSVLVKNGVIQLDEMYKAGMSKQHLFAALRKKMIYNLGQVKRVYFEACGLISVYEEQSPQAGLSVFPFHERELMHTQVQQDKSFRACGNCGNVVPQHETNRDCTVCNEKQWMEAVV